MAFKDILKSGFAFDKSEADLAFKFKILNTIMVIAAVFSLLFALLSDLGINDIGEIHAKVDYVYSFISIALLIYIRRSKACYENVAIAFVILSFYVFTSAMIFVPGDEFRLIWYYFVIYITYVLLGERAGVFMTAAVLAAIVICANLFDLQLSENALVTAVLGMLIASLLTRSYTVQMSHYEKELNAKNSALEVSVNELDSALGEAQQASRAKSLFLANMSHEIRTPMNGMLGMVQVMQATELSDEQQHYLETIDRSGKNLLSLIDELLDISKIESGRLELLPRPFDTFQWVIDIQILTEPLFEGRRVDFTTEVSENLHARLIADEQRLVQIIVNLVGNACKFTSEGEVKLSIGGEMIDASNYRLLVNVEDSGIGIPPEKVQDIFDSFHQITPERIDNEGVGLGLAISKRLVDAMQGRLDVSSREGEGSHFELEVVLPIAEQIDESGATERDESDRKLAILVVDDDSISRLAATTLLRQQGHEVYEAENGALAIEMVHQQSFEVVLMDVHMPVMDGISATRQIRADSDAAIAALPIIGLTASVMNDERENYIKSGMDAVVAKPIVIASLTRTIRHCLRS